MHAESKDTAEAFTLGINSDSASIPLHDFLDDKKAEPRTLLLLHRVFISTIRWAAAIIGLDCVLRGIAENI